MDNSPNINSLLTITTPLAAPQSWRVPSEHWMVALQHPWYRSLVKIQHALHMAVHEFFTQKRLITIFMPVTTASISSPMGLGSDSMPVEVDLDGVKTYLADSMQFMLEFGCRLHENGVYYIMPCFRGEKTDAYHLHQFYHVEAEIQGDITSVIDLASQLVNHVSIQMLNTCADEIMALAGSVRHLEELLRCGGRFPQYRLDEVLGELRTGDPSWVMRHPVGFEQVTRAGEQEFLRRYSSSGIAWLTHFDARAVPFYQAYEPGTGCAMNADLILGTCEVVGSGQRHSTRSEVEHALRQHEVNQEPYEWYLAMRDVISMQTSGFGMGLERYLLWLLQHNDIRDLTVLYRENGVAVIP